MNSTEVEYVGNELDNFSLAINWKQYWASMIKPSLGRKVLEVGAGIGSSTRILLSMASIDEWICLEPDPKFIRLLEKEKTEGKLPRYCELRQGTIINLESDERFDSILYIDVLEHIQDDLYEVKSAAKHLRRFGHLVILSPAYPQLFSTFDRAIGHYRRYTRAMLEEFEDASLKMRGIKYLDSVGVLPSLMNRLFFRSSLPSKAQLAFWDSYMIPISQVLDRWIGYQLGRSILGIFQKITD